MSLDINHFFEHVQHNFLLDFGTHTLAQQIQCWHNTLSFPHNIKNAIAMNDRSLRQTKTSQAIRINSRELLSVFVIQISKPEMYHLRHMEHVRQRSVESQLFCRNHPTFTIRKGFKMKTLLITILYLLFHGYVQLASYTAKILSYLAKNSVKMTYKSLPNITNSIPKFIMGSLTTLFKNLLRTYKLIR